LTHDESIGVLLGVNDGFAKLLQLVLPNDTRVTEPTTVRLDLRVAIVRGAEMARSCHRTRATVPEATLRWNGAAERI